MPTLGFTLVLLCLASGLWLSVRQHNAIGWMRHTLEVENRLNLVQRLATDAETGQRGYLLSHNEIYLQPYRDAVTRIPREVDALETAVVDNPRESDALRKLRPAIQGKLDELGATIALARMGRSAEAVDILRSDVGRQYMMQIRAAITAMTGEEERLLAARSAAVRRAIFSQSTRSSCHAFSYCCWASRRFATDAGDSGRWRP